MKRIVLGLIMAGGLALANAPKATAAVLGVCGKSYAMLITGAQPSSNQATGASPFPGALTSIVGVGEISFPAAIGTGCGAPTGELIFNNGDIQSTPPGVLFGPASCYASEDPITGGLPCFDGTNHFNSASSSIVTNGVNGNGSADLTILESGTQWTSSSLSTHSGSAGVISFEFTLQIGPGATTVLGNSKFSAGQPVLSLTMQRIGTSTGGSADVPTAYGTAPYLGNSVFNCTATEANQSDGISLSVNPPSIAGSFDSTVGAFQIFSDGTTAGSWSKNSNENIVTSGSTPNNDDCSFSVAPGNLTSGYGLAAAQFADGTSNAVETITSPPSDSTCTDAAIAGVGYTTSTVKWGSNEESGFLTVTGLTTTANGFVPPGSMSTCTALNTLLTGTLTSLVAPATAVANNTTVSEPIKLTSTTPASCDVGFALSGSTTDGICTVGLSTTSAVVPADTASSTYGDWTCSCAKSPPADSFTGATVTITSSNCPLSGTTSYPVTCRN
jgi:hypothetical protein